MKNRIIFSVILCICIISSAISQSRLEVNYLGGRMHTTETLGNTYPHLIQARIEMQQWNHEEALIHVDNAVAQNPGSAEALLVRAEIKRRMGMAREASQDVNMANRLNPYAANIFGYNGVSGIVNTIYFQPKEFLVELDIAQNTRYYKDIIVRHNSFSSDDDQYDSNSETLLLRAVDFIEKSEYESAINVLDTLIEIENQVAVSFDLEGLILMEQGKLGEATIMIEQAVILDSSLPMSWYNLGRLAMLSNEYEKAKVHFDKAIELDNEFISAYFQRAILSKKKGLYRDAIADYDKIISIDKGYIVEAYTNRGLANKAIGDYTSALNDLDISIQKSPEDPNLYKNRGNLYLLFGNDHRALLDYSRAIELDSNFAEAYFNRGIVKIVLLDYTEACSDLNKSLELGYEPAKDYLPFFCID